LQEGTTYYVRVKAEGEGAYVDSSYSNSVLVLGTPTFTLAQRGTDATALTITLDYVAGATTYSVDYSTDATFATYSTREYTSSGSKKLSGLQEGTTYYVRVTALAATGNVDSFVSATQSETTPSNQLATPTFTVVSRNPSSLSVTIGDVAGATGYAAQYSTDGATWTTATFETSGTKRLTGLAPNALYYVRVQATNGGVGDSDWSVSKSAQTASVRLSAPTLTVSTRDASSLNVSIGYVSNATKYVVEYALDSNFTTFWCAQFTSNGSKRLTNLEAGTTYFVRVKAEGADELGYFDSNWSSTSTVATNSAAVLAEEESALDAAFAAFDEFDFFADDEDDFGLF
jgi:hypothetical protein